MSASASGYGSLGIVSSAFLSANFATNGFPSSGPEMVTVALCGDTAGGAGVVPGASLSANFTTNEFPSSGPGTMTVPLCGVTAGAGVVPEPLIVAKLSVHDAFLWPST